MEFAAVRYNADAVASVAFTKVSLFMSSQTVYSLIPLAGSLNLIKENIESFSDVFYISFLSLVLLGAFFNLYLIYTLHYVHLSSQIHDPV